MKTVARRALLTVKHRLSPAVDFHRGIRSPLVAIATVAVCLNAITSGAVAQSAPDLTQTSLEDLMKIQVTSVSSKQQSLSKTASAVYVITQDDIRHSGATNIPDLLRMVPGVDVARINANAWAITIRGFNNRYSSKVLVLIDGRSVYTPLDSGVFWDQQSMPLEDIGRIEVIRGPGGTVWGANAMNGVINIISKSSKDTKGGLVSALAGSQDVAQGMAQYGGDAGTAGTYRIYGRYTMNGNSPAQPGSPAVDNGHESDLGFRSDLNLSTQDKLTLEGELFGASESQTITTLFSNRLPDSYTFNDGVRVSAENLEARWNHIFSDGSETTLQVYYDRFRRFDQGLNIETTGDADFRYHFHLGARNDLVFGLGYRLTDQSFTNGYAVAVGSGHRLDNLFSSFVQDEIRLTNTTALTMGIKLEHNAYTGLEYEPGVQFAWSPGTRHTFWAAASRAIQQPAWVYAQVQADAAAVPLGGGVVGIYQLNGNPRGAAPTVFDYELGYRSEISKRFTLDTNVFVASYRGLQTLEPQTPYFLPEQQVPLLVLPNVFENLGRAKDYGVEFSAHWDVTKWWRISPGYSFLQMDVTLDPASHDTSEFTATPGDSPKHQTQLRSGVKLPHKIEWDTSVYYVGRLAVGPVPSYTRLDTRLGWRIGEAIDISVVGQNLLAPRHLEFFDAREVTPTLAARDVFMRVTWRF